MYMDSLVVLAKPSPTLPIMLKLSMLVRWQMVMWWSCSGEGALGCSFYLSPNDLGEYIQYIYHHSPVYYICTSILYHFCTVLCPYPWVIQVFLDCSVSLEICLDGMIAMCSLCFCIGTAHIV